MLLNKNIYKFFKKNVWILLGFLLPNVVLFSQVDSVNNHKFTEKKSKKYNLVSDNENQTSGLKSIPEMVSSYKNDLNKYHKNIVIVKFRQDIELSDDSKSFLNTEIQDLFSKLQIIKIRKPYDYIFNQKGKFSDNFGISNIYEIYYLSEIDPMDFCAKIKHPLIEYVNPLFQYEFMNIPNDTLYQNQWELKNILFENIPDTLNFKKQVVIAIVDTEVDWEHNDLFDNIWINPNEIPDNNIDDDGNGKIDDVHGWDFMGITSYKDYREGIIYQDNDTKIRDTATKHNHGTLVASCAAEIGRAHV